MLMHMYASKSLILMHVFFFFCLFNYIPTYDITKWDQRTTWTNLYRPGMDIASAPSSFNPKSTCGCKTSEQKNDSEKQS